MASATAFTAVKWLGAAYLCYVGLTMLLSRSRLADEAAPGESDGVTLSRVFWQGALTNVLNPKVALFFLAFLPQFVDPEASHKALAFLALGLMFIASGTVWCLTIAIVAAGAAGRVKKSGRAMDLINRGLGALFVYLGARIALAQAR
jgi:threonine/homoserine/homoserine lactone efflux protein